MNSAELKQKAWDIISGARTQKAKKDEERADKILEIIPDCIKEAIAENRTVATVMWLDEEPKLKTPRGPISQHAAKAFIHNRQPRSFPYDDLFGTIFPQQTAEYELTGVAKIVFERCYEAGLNPFVAQAENDKSKWGIGITWN